MSRAGRRLLTLFSGAGKSWIEKNALLYDTFKTDDAAPITSPRTCEPGPGLLVVVDTENKLSLSGGDLVCTGGKTVPAQGDPGVWLANTGPAAYTMAAGYAGFADYTPSATNKTSQFGLDSNTAGDVLPSFFFNATNLKFYNRLGSVVGTIANGYSAEQMKLLLVQRSSTHGYFYIMDGELLWSDDTSINSSAYPALSNLDHVFTSADLALLPLADYNAAWGGDWSEVTDTDATPTATESVDRAAGSCLIEFGDITLPSDAMAVQIRRVDATNYTTLDIAADGSATIKETIAGSEGAALVSIGASGISDASDLKVLDSAGTVKVFSAGVLAGTATLTDHAEATLVYVEDLGTGGALSEVTTHPLSLGIATSRVVCPQVNDTADCPADFILELKNVTLPSTDSYHTFRNSHPTTLSRLKLSSDGSGRIEQFNPNVNRILFSAGTFSNGDNVVIVADGAYLEVFVNGSSVGSETEMANPTGTGYVFTLANSSTLDHIACFPRDVSSILPKGTY